MDTARWLIRGQGWGPLATDRYCQGAEAAEKSTTHTHTKQQQNPHSIIPSFAFTLLSFTFLSRKGDCMSRICHPRVPAAAPVSVCTFVFLLYFSFLFFFFWHLSPCSVGMSMLCPPSMTRASHSARWTSHLANLHSLHKS